MTPRQLLVSSFLAFPLAAVSLAASAQDARTAKWVNLRAGPDRDYPLVGSFGPGIALAVQGCTAGYGWCDVIGPNGARGWVYAGNINYAYQSGYVPLLNYGPQIGLPIVTFVIGSYWGSYYRNRPFYNTIPRWQHHRPPPRPIVRPPGPPPRPGVRPPDGHRPPVGVRPPGGNRPPPSVRPPGGGRPGDGGGGRPPGGGGRPDGDGGGRPGPGGDGGRPGGQGDKPDR